MQFCPRCGSVLVQKRKNFGCVKCSYSSSEKVKIQATENIQKRMETPGVLREKESNVWPITSAACPKCGHREAFFWSAQMRAGDEAETRFFRCVKCKHTWREYT